MDEQTKLAFFFIQHLSKLWISNCNEYERWTQVLKFF